MASSLLPAVLLVFASVAFSKNVPPKKQPSIDGDFTLLNKETPDGSPFFEGDIVLTDDQWNRVKGKKAVADLAYRWPNEPNEFPVIPYRFGDDSVDKTDVLNGIAHWEEKTCIKFRLDESQTMSHLSFILGSGCWSYIGNINRLYGQEVSIGDGCGGLGIVAHEIGHALGLYHEQSRSDRDSYVTILIENIISETAGNFMTHYDNNYSVPYDFVSDMHYVGKAFTNNGKFTIATVDPMNQELIGKRSGLSHMDALIANKMYPCIEMWLQNCSLTTDPCLNYGYTGADCTCVCPSGTSGTNCENLDADYYDQYRYGYSEIITSDAHPVTSPNYPDNYPANIKLTKVIEAPECHQVQLNFTHFSIYGRNPYCHGESCCYFEILQIRTDGQPNADVFCDVDIVPGTVFTSLLNKMVLYFESATYWLEGWSADIAFIPVPGCIETTSAPAPSTCIQENVSDSEVHWTSPLFGQSNYLDNQECSLTLTSDEPSWARVTINSLDLESGCFDFVSFTKPYNLGEVKLCDTQTGEVLLPSFNTVGSFLSDETINAAGFDLTITKETTSCHQVITLTESGQTISFRTPSATNGAWLAVGCEWWIQSPEGTKIVLSSILSIRKCPSENVLVNIDGDPAYPVATTKEFCGRYRRLTEMATSNNNKMAILYYSGITRSSMKATVMAVPA
ncbi:blastula protease 10-like [Palaemon carinicauda]|uniref:blastula protease 10-like n=1 Tax=Palaemon carinicauda TaxID=392227 RepID=UPI0035B692D4